jgi:fused signal recognition particle receptor
MGFLDKIGFNKLKDGLTKTKDNLVQKVASIVSSYKKIDENLFDELEESLIAGDVGAATAEKIITDLKIKVRKEKIELTDNLMKIIKDEVASLFIDIPDGEKNYELTDDKKPYVVLVVGVNGVGKTTTIGKLAYNYKNNGYNVVIGAADTFRAAANEQLEVWAERAGVKIIQQKTGADPSAVAFDTLKFAQSQNADMVIIDTAGRLHTKVNLMEELKKIKRVMQKVIDYAPNDVLLVLDATTGQNAIQQAKIFGDAVGLTGIVLTKLDGTAKCGIVLAIANELKLPVKFIGVGEKIDDLQPFDKNSFVDILFERATDNV